MLRILASAATALITMLALDALWIWWVALPMYRAALGNIMLASPRGAPGILFYLIYITGIVVLVLPAATSTGRWTVALGLGMMFGLCCYGTFSLTNLTILRSWSYKLAIADILWGTILTGLVSVVAYKVSRALS